jgi:cell fate regulator YaaT (PSP1 superfamily)
MNNIAVLPYIGLHALQIQNVKRNTAKKVSINELNNEVISIENTNVVTNVVEGEAPNVVKSTTKIDDLPSVTNNNQQENVSNHLKNE